MLRFIPVENHAPWHARNAYLPRMEAFRLAPIYIQTDALSIQLVHTAPQVRTPISNIFYPGANQTPEAPSWVWAVSMRDNTPLGFIALNTTPSRSDPVCHFGPHMEVACRRDDKYARFIPDAIDALLAWLRDNNVCIVVHASHDGADESLANWLVAAGFLYTGCRGQDDRRQMICLL